MSIDHSNEVAIQSTDESPSLKKYTASAAAPEPRPLGSLDGGFLAWLQCAGSFFLFFSSWGIVNSFGVYQTFYEQNFLSGESPSDISWIGSVQAFLLISGSIVAGPLYDRGYLRLLLYTGSFLTVFGMMMTSICTAYWQAFLAQGLVVGLGNGCLFIPSVAILPAYFHKKRALALGIGAAGSSVGGVLYSIIFFQLQPQVGFGWATRCIAFIMLATLMIPVLGLKMRSKPPKPRKLFDLRVFNEIAFASLGAATFFGFLGLYLPFFYIQTYSLKETKVNGNLISYLVPLLNTGSFFGRIIPNYVADKIGPVNTLIPCTSLAATLTLIWISIKSSGGIIVFCLLYGFFSGAFVSLNPAVTASLCPDLGSLGTRMSMICIPLSVGLLIGNPIAGSLIRYGWVAMQVFCGTSIFIAAICLTAIRLTKVGTKLRSVS